LAKELLYDRKSYYELEELWSCILIICHPLYEEPKNAEIPYLIARSYVDMNNYKPANTYPKSDCSGFPAKPNGYMNVPWYMPQST